MKQSLNIELLAITILVAAFGFTTFQRNFVWKDDYTFGGIALKSLMKR